MSKTPNSRPDGTETTSDLLSQTLTYLERLPASCSQWEADIPKFLASITDMLEKKTADRNAAASLDHFTNALSEFQGQHSSDVEYFELDTSAWTAPTTFDAPSLIAVHGLIENLSALLYEYRSIPQRGSSITETRDLDQRRSDIEHRILGIKSSIDQALAAEDGPDGPDSPLTAVIATGMPDVQPTGPEASSDATLSDLGLVDVSIQFDPHAPVHLVSLHNHIDTLGMAPVPNVDAATVEVSIEPQDQGRASCVQDEAGHYRIENLGVGRTTVSVTVTAEDALTSQTYTLSIDRLPSDDATLMSLSLNTEELAFDPTVMEYSVDLAANANSQSVSFATTNASATVCATLQSPDGTVVALDISTEGTCVIPTPCYGLSTLTLTVTAEDGVAMCSYKVSLISPLHPAVDHHTIMWSLVGDDDVAGAYWLSESLANQDLVPAHLPTVLKAVQAARWLSLDSRAFVDDLSAIVLQSDVSSDNDAHVMLRLAASIQPSLIVPETNLLKWLATPPGFSFLDRLVTPIHIFASKGHALRPEYIAGDEWNRHLEDLISEAISSAQSWLEDSGKRYHNFVRANNVWRHLCADQGTLDNLLRMVVSDDRLRLGDVKAIVARLHDEVHRTKLIGDTDRALYPNPKSEIVGAARDWLHRGINNACALALRWCDLVEQSNNAGNRSRNQWLIDNITELRNSMDSVSPNVLDRLSEISCDTTRPDLAASARCLSRSIHRLLEYLRLDHAQAPPPPMPILVNDLAMINQYARQLYCNLTPASQLDTALSRRLLWIPHVELADDGMPADVDAPIALGEANSDWFANTVTRHEAAAARIHTQDFRFLNLLMFQPPTGKSDDAEFNFASELAAETALLRNHHAATRAAVEQAASDGVIEFEGTHWNTLVNSLDDIIVCEVRHFRRAHRILEDIAATIVNERIHRRQEIIDHWDRVTRSRHSDTGVDSDIINDLAATFALASHHDSPNIRVMEDCLTRMESYLSGDRHDVIPRRPAAPQEALEAFLSFSQNIGDSNVARARADGLKHMLSRIQDKE